ncbi:MAG: hypothetical protein QOI95_3531 [Acidimicrobiaceae bacterium]|jgi:hypothetical protein
MRRLPYVTTIAIALAYARRQSFVVGGDRYFVLFDDAMISMRYGRNLTSGHGLAYNTAGHAVEGFTNPLWTLWMSVLNLAPLPLRLASLMVVLSGLVILLVNLYLVERIARLLSPESGLAVTIAVWLTALCGPVLMWTVLGMEVGLVSLVTLLGVFLCLRWIESGATADMWWLAVVIALSTTVRPDVTVAAFVIAFYAAWRSPPERRRVAFIVFIGAVVLALVAQTLVRLAYYGEPLPNTYYLKVSGISLQARLRRGLLHLVAEGIQHLYAPVLLAVAWLLTRRAGRRGAGLLLLIVAAQLAYSVYVGGDSYDGGEAGSRYIAAVLPCLAIVAALGVDALRFVSGRARTAFAALGLLSLPAVMLLRAANVQPGVNSQLGPSARDPALLRILLPLVLLGAVLAALWSRRSSWPLVVLAVALVAASSAHHLDGALRQPSGAAAFDQRMTRYALALRSATDREATIATGAAGELGYFTERQIVDLLGYTDDHIAHLAPTGGAFIPGHNKFDVSYSIGVLRPDVIAGTFPRQSEAVRAQIIGYGYEEIGTQLFVRRDSTRVDRDALRAFVADPTSGALILSR